MRQKLPPIQKGEKPENIMNS